jgi:hypothetical protein
MKVMLPVELDGETRAVSFTLWPYAEGLEDEVSVVVVVA